MMKGRENKLGLRGVSEMKSKKTGIIRYRAMLQRKGKCIFLGTHETPEQAFAACEEYIKTEQYDK